MQNIKYKINCYLARLFMYSMYCMLASPLNFYLHLPLPHSTLWSTLRSRSFSQSGPLLSLSLYFIVFYQSFLLMLLSYLDHMTGFYLCYSYISILLLFCCPTTVILQFCGFAFHVNCDESSKLCTSHLVSLDSASMTSFNRIGGLPIPSIISTSRPLANHHNNRVRVRSLVILSYPIETLITKRKPSVIARPVSNHHNKRARVLKLVQLFYPIETLITKRKPSGYGKCLQNSGLRISRNRTPINLLQIKRSSTNNHKPVHLPINTSLPSIYIHNIRSLNVEKFHELKLLTQNYDLIMLTESWLTDAKETLYNIEGFCLHTCNRAGKRAGGGVAVYIRDTLSVLKLTEYSNHSVSAYWFLLQQENQFPVIYANIYHPPGLLKKAKDQTMDHIVMNVSRLLKKYPLAKLFLTGDFNDLDTGSITTALPLEQIVNFPTRGDNCLDLIFTDIPEYIKSGCTALPPIMNNDHLAISVPWVNRIPPPKYITIKKRNITPATKVAVSEELSTLLWTELYNAETVDSKVSILHQMVDSILDKHCPVCSVRTPISKPTLTSPLIRKLSRAKKRAHQKRNPVWKAISKLLSQQLRKQMAVKTSEKVNKTITGSKNWWSNVRRLTGEQHQVSAAPLISMNNRWLNKSQFARQLNDYYLQDHDKFSLDYPDIPSTTGPYPTVDEMTVYKLMRKINTNKATNREDFPSWVSNNNAHFLAQPLTNIINSILQTGKFPRLWKRAEITPLNKVRSPQTFKELRPISLLFHLGKVAESVLSNLIKQELPQLKDQYAYTKQRSTTDALVKFSTDIAYNLDKKDTLAVQALMLDFSKAFDRLLPDYTVRKLLHLGVQPYLIQVVKSFFCERQQRVKYADICSEYRNCRIGVPQGTIMGPLLWNVFVDDLRPDTNTHYIKYADDTTIYNIIKKDEVTISKSTPRSVSFSFPSNPLQNAGNYASEWCDQNSMLLNAAKSQTINFSLQKKIDCAPIEINNTAIQQTSTVKLLGVIFDSHMKFTDHVTSIIEKARPVIHAVIKLKKIGVTSYNLSRFYKSRVLPIIAYAAPSWFPYISENDKERLERLQKLCLKIISPDIESYEERLTHLRLESLSIYLDVACLGYVSKIKLIADHPLSNELPKLPKTARTRQNAFTRPFCRTALYGKSLFYKYC